MKASHWIIIGGFLVIVMLIGFLFRDRSLEEDWRVELRRMQREQAAWEAQDFSRRPLHSEHRAEELKDENAWPHLRLATTLAREGSTRWQDSHGGQSIHAALAKDRGRDLAAEEELLQQALQELRLAARSSFARAPVDWEAGFSHEALKLLDTRLLTNILVANAEAQAEAGRDMKAVLLLADALNLGRDLAVGSATQVEDLVGTSNITLVCKAIAESQSLMVLAPDALAELAVCLEILDTDLAPCGASMQANFPLARNTLMSPPGGIADLDRGRVLSSLRWIEELTDLAQRSAPLPWEDVQELWSAAPAGKALAGQDSIIKSATWLHLLEVRRAAQAIVRMTRMAVAERRREEWSALPDPFGTELLWARAEGRLELWTAKSQSGSDWLKLSALVAN